MFTYAPASKAELPSTILSGESYSVSGTETLDGALINDGSIYSAAGGALQNNGVLFNNGDILVSSYYHSPLTINNNNTLYNYGSIFNSDQGAFNGSGTYGFS